MAFNREDLITWNELAPSLQTILQALQTEVMAGTQRVSKMTSQVNNLPTTTSVDRQIQTYIENTLLPNLGSATVVKNISNKVDSVETTLTNHMNSIDPHPNTGADFLIHHTNHDYDVNDRVYEFSLPTYYVLECVQAGTSANVKPNFSQYINN